MRQAASAARSIMPPRMPTAARLCDSHGICFCSAGTERAQAHAYKHEVERLADQVRRAQALSCSSNVRRVRVSLPAFGLGGSIFEHLRRLTPVWHTILERTDCESLSCEPLSIAVPTYEHFAADAHLPHDKHGHADAYLWATFDDTLRCDAWYGCYWEDFTAACPNSTSVTLPVGKFAPYMASRFERKWGGILFAAALLETWWRPTVALQQRVDKGVKRVFGGFDPSAAPAQCLALHVRRGDACLTQWRRCPSTEDYLAVARVLARRHGLTRLLVASEDAAVIEGVRAAAARSPDEPWGQQIHWQQYDRAPFNVTSWSNHNTRYWVEQRLRWAKYGERPLGKRPVLDFLVDLEAASHCAALVGTMDSHGSRLMLLRMASRLGYVPPFSSLVGPTCPLSGLPVGLRGWCENHTSVQQMSDLTGGCLQDG